MVDIIVTYSNFLVINKICLLDVLLISCLCCDDVGIFLSVKSDHRRIFRVLPTNIHYTNLIHWPMYCHQMRYIFIYIYIYKKTDAILRKLATITTTMTTTSTVKDVEETRFSNESVSLSLSLPISPFS